VVRGGSWNNNNENNYRCANRNNNQPDNRNNNLGFRVARSVQLSSRKMVKIDAGHSWMSGRVLSLTDSLQQRGATKSCLKAQKKRRSGNLSIIGTGCRTFIFIFY
jgi:hypothetical protein